MPTTTNLTTLKINYLTQAQYDDALANNQINSNELYFTPHIPESTGSTNSVSKLFLIGATSQTTNPQTYSSDQVYIAAGTAGSSDGYLYARRVYNAV